MFSIFQVVDHHYTTDVGDAPEFVAGSSMNKYVSTLHVVRSSSHDNGTYTCVAIMTMAPTLCYDPKALAPRGHSRYVDPRDHIETTMTQGTTGIPFMPRQPSMFLVKKCFIFTFIYLYNLIYIPGVPEKAEWWIFSTLRAESVVYFYIIRWSIFRRRE